MGEISLILILVTCRAKTVKKQRQKSQKTNHEYSTLPHCLRFFHFVTLEKGVSLITVLNETTVRTLPVRQVHMHLARRTVFRIADKKSPFGKENPVCWKFRFGRGWDLSVLESLAVGWRRAAT